jgi:hypothetical protein
VPNPFNLSGGIFPGLLEAAVAGGSLWGWGRLIRSLAPGRPLAAPLTLALGLGGILFIGGLLNLAGIACSAALDALVLAGLVAALPSLLTAIRRRRGISASDGLALIPVLVVGWFAAAHLAPQQSFNIYDDFEKYFAFPVKMLATGTLGGNPLSAIGGETLGGQAFLQAFVVAHLPPAYVGTADTFLSLLLCVALAGFGLGSGRRLGMALVAEVAVVILNPEIINISAVFSGAALVMAAIFLAGEPSGEGEAPVPSAWLGLLYAGLIALKTTFLIFVVFHLVALALARAGLDGRRGGWLRPAVGAAAWTAGFLAPWLLLSAAHYWAGWHAATLRPPAIGAEWLSVFSTAPELYGGTQAHYTALGLAVLLVAAIGVLARWRRWVGPSPGLASATAGLATAGAAYFVLVLALAPAFGREGATRYAGPIFIGAIPAAIRILGGLEWRPGWPRFLPVTVLGAAVAAFLPSAVARVRQIEGYGSPLAFSPSVTAPAFIAYNRDVLAGGARARLAAAQRLVPPGAPLLAWVCNPFLLDFKRNPVTETNPAGLGSRWAWPPSARYILWEYRGYAVKYPGFVVWTPRDYTRIFYGECLVDRINSARALAFVDFLQAVSRRADLLYNDGSLALFRRRP